MPHRINSNTNILLYLILTQYIPPIIPVRGSSSIRIYGRGLGAQPRPMQSGVRCVSSLIRNKQIAIRGSAGGPGGSSSARTPVLGAEAGRLVSRGFASGGRVLANFLLISFELRPRGWNFLRELQLFCVI